MAVGLAGFFAAIRIWVGERVDLFVFNAFVASFALLLFFAPMRDRIQSAIERRFVAGKVALETGLRPLRERLKHILTLDELLEELLAALEKAELFRASSIFLRDDATLGFQLAGSIGLPTRTRVSLLSEPVWVSTLEEVAVLQRDELERWLDDPKNAARAPAPRGCCARRCAISTPSWCCRCARSRRWSASGRWPTRARASRSRPTRCGLLRAVADQIATSLENSKTFERVRARDRFVSLGEMAAGLAHEIRNPLAAIRGAVAVLQQPSDAKAAELWTVIIEEIARLNRVVESFLDYARPATRPRDDPRRGRVREELRRGGLALEGPRRASSSSSRSSRTSLQLRADADQLERVVVNVVQNAYEALEERGRVRVAVRRARAAGRTTAGSRSGRRRRSGHERHHARARLHPLLHHEAAGHRARPRAVRAADPRAGRHDPAALAARRRHERADPPALPEAKPAEEPA